MYREVEPKRLNAINHLALLNAKRAEFRKTRAVSGTVSDTMPNAQGTFLLQVQPSIHLIARTCTLIQCLQSLLRVEPLCQTLVTFMPNISGRRLCLLHSLDCHSFPMETPHTLLCLSLVALAVELDLNAVVHQVLGLYLSYWLAK